MSMTPLFSVSGLGSGLDWKKMIDEIMAIERQPVQALEQRKGRLEDVKKAWTDIETAIRTVDGKLDPLLLNSTFQARVATSSSTSVVTASASTGAATGSYAVEVTALAQAQVVASDAQADPAAALNLSGTFTINGQAITVVTTDSLLGIRDKINTTANVGVTASVVDKRLVLKSNSTGTAGEFAVVGDVAQTLGVINADGTYKNQLVAAQDAQFKVDGLALVRGSNTVTDVISGVTLQLQGVGTSTVEVKADVDGMAAKIKDFVNAYNTALSKLRSYTVKTDPAVPAPLLMGDPTAQGMEGQLRKLAYEAVAGLAPDMDSLYDIGISTAGRDGQLQVDEAKLRDVLARRPQDVATLFSSPTTQSVAEKFRDAFRFWLQASTGLFATREQGIDRQVQGMVERMRTLEDRLALRERRLTEQ
ncbi:MAG TPA: flagellar filament capping protein FliD, partial [Firmicutes bacterium]|nr:flagellar filament capping protein FliD [Bacillota bacterium]